MRFVFVHSYSKVRCADFCERAIQNSIIIIINYTITGAGFNKILTSTVTELLTAAEEVSQLTQSLMPELIQSTWTLTVLTGPAVAYRVEG